MKESIRTICEAEDKKQLEDIANNIMGAIMSCKDDCWFTINYASMGLLRLTGFTCDELRDLFQNRFILLIYPEDADNMKKEFEEQRKLSDYIELEYRLVCKDGGTVWVLEKGKLHKDENGNYTYYSVFFDITERKTLQLQQAMRNEHIRKIIEQEGDILLEWTISNDTLFCSPNFKIKFGYELPDKFCLEYAIDHVIYEADIPLFRQRLQYLLNGKVPCGDDYRIKKESGEYLWCKIRSTVLCDSDGNPQKVICILSDIDSQKKERLMLEAKAQRDLLTGAYNKITAQSLIEDYLNGDGKDGYHALFVIDIDNFKSINDHLGHLKGDSVLSSISSCLAKQFRPNDIVGRIGGDEFMVLLKNIPSIELAEQKAQHLVHVFRNVLCDIDNDFTISGSIGISIYPDHGHQFEELFRKADAALYFSKGHGKDCYQVYSCQVVPSSERSYLSTEQSLRRDLARCVFEILYDTQDICPAIRHILGITGRYYSVPHVYIFESHEDDGKLIWENTFEWCSDLGLPFSQNYVNYLNIHSEEYIKLFDDNGIFYCSDLSLLPHELEQSLRNREANSILQSAIVRNGCIKGFIGFSESIPGRLWNKAEIEAVILISKILGVFLLNDRSRNELQQSNFTAKAIIDRMNVCAYVLRKEDYKILYANDLARQYHPELEIGKTCFSCSYGKLPCSRCPIDELDDNVDRWTVNFCNACHMWSECSVSKMKWTDGKEAYLIICNDAAK